MKITSMFSKRKSAYIIAEIGANHNGDMNLAKKMIDKAKECGADAVKFQSWDTNLFSKKVYNDNYFLSDDYRNRKDYTLKQMVKKFALNKKQLFELKLYSDKRKIQFSTTPFSNQQVTDIQKFKVPFIKIASMDINNPFLLKKSAKSGLNIVLSTGFSTMSEISRAIDYLNFYGNNKICLLHCIGLYPPPSDNLINLNNMQMLEKAYGYPVGFSDHTLGTDVSIAAISLGAKVLEKHFTLDKNMFGWDHHISACPEELSIICKARDRISLALGSSARKVSKLELIRRKSYRRSITLKKSLKKGHKIALKDIEFRRPGTGIDPFEWQKIIGRTLKKNLEKEHVLSYEDLL